jgi:hypothetical protein
MHPTLMLLLGLLLTVCILAKASGIALFIGVFFCIVFWCLSLIKQDTVVAPTIKAVAQGIEPIAAEVLPDTPKEAPIKTAKASHMETPLRLKEPMDTFVSLDTETANQERGSVCSLALTKVVNGKIVDRYHSYIKPIPLQFNVVNQRIHGISKTTVRNAPTIGDLWQSIEAFIGGLPLVAHNVAFDKAALEKSLDKCGISATLPMYCSMTEAAQRHLPSGLKLLSARYGIPCTTTMRRAMPTLVPCVFWQYKLFRLTCQRLKPQRSKHLF